jgi:hypothetical protein
MLLGDNIMNRICFNGDIRKILEAASGFEPENNDFADRCLTTWLCRQKNGAGNEIRTRDFNLGKVALYH